MFVINVDLDPGMVLRLHTQRVKASYLILTLAANHYA
jgi:hypothetical protein